MIHWIKAVFGSKRTVPVRPEEEARREASTCGRQDHIKPRPSHVTFDQAMDLVLREHGETLRELADK